MLRFSRFQIKGILRYFMPLELKGAVLLISNVFAADADPDSKNTFDADPDPDPTPK
jgi:hypothetical protein